MRLLFVLIAGCAWAAPPTPCFQSTRLRRALPWGAAL